MSDPSQDGKGTSGGVTKPRPMMKYVHFTAILVFLTRHDRIAISGTLSVCDYLLYGIVSQLA